MAQLSNCFPRQGKRLPNQDYTRRQRRVSNGHMNAGPAAHGTGPANPRQTVFPVLGLTPAQWQDRQTVAVRVSSIIMAKTSGTLLEVARRCAVSQSTVSRVLNNRSPGRFSVSEAVRERILKTAAELNYRPSVAARNLTVSKTHLVAILGIAGIWSDRVGPVEEAVGALALALDAAGYEICAQFLSRRHGPFDPPPLRVDGVVAVGPRRAEDLVGLEAMGVPYVSVNGMAGPNGSQVAPDDAKGARLALKHLVDLGHRRIAYLDHWAVGADHPSVLERRAAFARGADELGFRAVDPGLPLLPADSPWDSLYEPFVRRTILEGGATAVLTYSHQGALALLRVGHDLGLAVPRDFSLVCFNDEPVVRIAVPSLTAIDVPGARMGKTAAELLLRHMAAADDDPRPRPQQIRLEESLVVRESTAPPPPTTSTRAATPS
jgi:DNA-binding LacI/PurR family transcriptional regulator